VLIQIKKILEIRTAPITVSDKWIPRSEVKKFFDYEDTQIAEFEKRDEIIVTVIGKRHFIRRDSIEKLLDSNIIES
jgi:S-adenosylhomocysteine hydrolase